MSIELTFWLAVGSLAVTCFAAVAAQALREFSRHALEDICRRRKSKALLKEILLYHERVALGAETLQVVATAVLVSASTSWVWMRSGVSGEAPSWTILLTSAAVGGLLLLAVEIWLPWAVARLWAEWFLYYCWRICRLISLALSPLVLAASFVDTVFHRLAGRQPERPTEESFEEEIRTIVTEGHREGLLEEDAREMIEGIIDLGDADVSEIMTPRTDMVSLPLEKTLSEALQFVVSVAHTRIPVYNKNRDDVVGILYAKDLLPKLAQPGAVDSTPLSEILREPYFVPETKRVDDLLQEFQRTRNHMAVVLDEYGGVSGVVTIEDVLEEIVGEIVDEYDEELVEGIKRIDERTAEALARVHVDEINERLGLDLPEDGEFDTIGGYVFHELGHVPRAGEKLVRNGVRLTVLEATRRRIERVRIEMIDRARETA